MWSQGNNRGYILAKYNESGGKEYSKIAAILTRENPTMIKDNPEEPVRTEEERISAMVVKEVVEAEEEGVLIETPIKISKKDDELRNVAMTPVVLKLD